jgi:predicted RNase H-like HicB family nuclease
MAHHDEILAAVGRICKERGAWTFRPDEIVRALPHLNAGTIRTHVTSRCCVNAPTNHPHKWDYFTRVSRGLYELRSKYRAGHKSGASLVRESRAQYGGRTPLTSEPRHAIHTVITRSGGWFSAECLELPVVTQGRTLDETVSNLRAAVALHLEGEDLAALGLSRALALHVTFEEALSGVT